MDWLGGQIEKLLLKFADACMGLLEKFYRVRAARTDSETSKIRRQTELLELEEAQNRKQNREREERVDKYVRFFEEHVAQQVTKSPWLKNPGFLSPPVAAPGEDPDEVREAFERYCARRNRYAQRVA